MMIIQYVSFISGVFISSEIAKKEKTEDNYRYYSFSKLMYLICFTLGLLPAIYLNNYVLSFILGALIVQALLDIKYKELSDRVTFFVFLTSVIYTLIMIDMSRWKYIGFTSIICFLFYLIPHLISKGRVMGGGDVKISFILGLVGQYNLLQSLTFPLIVYIVYFVATHFFQDKGNRKTREFFPSLLISFFIIAVYNKM